MLKITPVENDILAMRCDLTESNAHIILRQTTGQTWAITLMRPLNAKYDSCVYADTFVHHGDKETAMAMAVDNIRKHAEKQNGFWTDILTELSNEPEKKFIAVIKSSAVRDTQIAVAEDPDPVNDDDWYDLRSAQVYLGVYSGDEDTCRKNAAKYACTDPTNIKLIPV